MGYNNIGSDGTTALAAVLPRCAALARMTLNGNKFGHIGAGALAAALPKCVALTELDLSAAKIGDVGATELMKVIPKCKLLRLLIPYNKIGEAGAHAWANALRISAIDMDPGWSDCNHDVLRQLNLYNYVIGAWRTNSRHAYDERILTIILALYVRNNNVRNNIAGNDLLCLSWELMHYIVEQFLIELKQE